MPNVSPFPAATYLADDEGVVVSILPGNCSEMCGYGSRLALHNGRTVVEETAAPQKLSTISPVQILEINLVEQDR